MRFAALPADAAALNFCRQRKPGQDLSRAVSLGKIRYPATRSLDSTTVICTQQMKADAEIASGNDRGRARRKPEKQPADGASDENEDEHEDDTED